VTKSVKSLIGLRFHKQREKVIKMEFIHILNVEVYNQNTVFVTSQPKIYIKQV